MQQKELHYTLCTDVLSEKYQSLVHVVLSYTAHMIETELNKANEDSVWKWFS